VLSAYLHHLQFIWSHRHPFQRGGCDYSKSCNATPQNPNLDRASKHPSNVTEPPQERWVRIPRSYWGILDEVRIHKHITYKHTIPYMKFKLKLLHFMGHVLELQKREAQKTSSKDHTEF
jgi:hypothetical protein